jgi:hypothetical protein
MTEVPKPDLREAQRLLGAGLRLVKMQPFTKQPDGVEWNKHAVTAIDPAATGYGLLLAQNKLCSLDPDNYELAVVGMKALGFDLEKLMTVGVRTASTRPGSGGRSTFAADGEIAWLKFSCKRFGTVLELRADSPNLQDTIPGVVYRDRAGALCTQRYANDRRLDEAPALPDDLFEWWELASINVEFLRDQQAKFFAAVAAHIGEPPDTIKVHKAISTAKGGGKLAFEAPGIRSGFNRTHDVADILERHGYSSHKALDRWSCPAASGAPGIRQIPDHAGLWRSDHASDPLHGTFDAWAAHVVLDHDGDLAAALRGQIPEPPPADEDPGFDASDDGAHEKPEQPLRLVALDITRILQPIPPERFLLPGLVPTDAYTLIAGALSTYKSTLLLYMLVWKATGFDLLGLDPTGAGTDIGHAVLVFYEDADFRVEGRLHRILQDGHAMIGRQFGARAAQEFLECAVKHLHRIPLTGCAGNTLVCRLDGSVYPNETYLKDLLCSIRAVARSDVMIGIDPLRLAIVGSQNDDDGADVVVHTLNRLAAALPRSGVVICSHTTKSGAVEPGTGYAAAAYATSGSALYSQHARSNFHVTRLPPEKIGELFDVADVPLDERQRQPVAQITHGRLSHGPESDARYVRMDGGLLRPVRPRGVQTVAERLTAGLGRVADAIDRLHEAQLRASAAALAGDESLRRQLGRDGVRNMVRLLEENGYIEAGGTTKNRDYTVTEKGRLATCANPRESEQVA